MLPSILPFLLLAAPTQGATGEAQGAGHADAPAPLFREDPAALPDVRTTCGSPQKNAILEVDGGGLALEDFDLDGDVDLVVVDGSTLERVQSGAPGFPPRLFLNDGRGHFEPAGDAWKMDGGRWGFGAAVGDVNGDGWPDLAVTQWGPTRLFLNQGGRGFHETTATCGFSGERWGSSAAFLDYDRDGALDLAQINYLVFDPETLSTKACNWKGYPVMCGPEGLTPVHDQLWRGKGAEGRGDGTFEDVTVAAGFRPPQAGYGLGVMTLDFDLDGDTDVYVSNDSTPNFLWENQGDGTFREVGLKSGVSHDVNGKEQAGMGIGCGDVDGDGRPDLLVTNFSGESNSLYTSRGKRGFREEAARTGLGGPSMTRLGWGTALADLDLDGDLDAFVLNGHVYPEADQPGTDTHYAQDDQLYENAGARFTVRALHDGPARVSRAGALADLDGDGDLDLVAIELDGPVHVLFNRTRAPGQEDGPHWLAVRCRGKGGNTHALGALVSVRKGDAHADSEVRSSAGYQAAVPARAHFGLGATKRIDTVSVRFPSGQVVALKDVDGDRVIEVVEP